MLVVFFLLVFGAPAPSAPSVDHPCHPLARNAKWPEATRCYKTSLEKNANDLEARNGLAAVHAQQGQFKESLAQFELALKTNAADGVALNGRAMMLLALKRVDEAFEALQKALEVDPDNLQALSNLALINHESGHDEIAVPLWKRILEIEPSDVDALLGLGEVRMEKGDVDGAYKNHFLKVLEKNPKNARAQWLAGKAVAQQRPADAVPFLENAAALAPKEPEVWYDLGVARMAAGEMRLGGQALTQAMELAPNDPRIYLEMGKVHLHMRDFEAADAHFEAALAMKPSNEIKATIRYHSGILRERQGNARKAEDEYRLALKILPEHVPSMVNLAALLVEEKRYDVALPPLQKALELDPKNAAARYNLGRLLIEQGKIEEGKKQLTPLLMRPKGDPIREGAESVLARVGK